MNVLDVPGKITETALYLPLRLAYGEWAKIGHHLKQVKEWSAFAIGDWLNYGQDHFNEEYAQGASELGLKPDSLQTLQYVAKRVEPIRRRKELTWSHHREVASLKADEQTDWLDKAVKSDWSVSDLKEHLADAGVRKRRKGSNPRADDEVVTRQKPADCGTADDSLRDKRSESKEAAGCHTSEVRPSDHPFVWDNRGGADCAVCGEGPVGHLRIVATCPQCGHTITIGGENNGRGKTQARATA